MDPITHAVVGVSIAVLCGEPIALSNPALLGCIAGAVIPDSDIIMQFKGSFSYLKSHRGFSHSIPMMFIYAIFITSAIVMLFDSTLWTKIISFTLLGCFSHILLDITNSYGARIIAPFNQKRITFDLLLVYDPILIILSALIILPSTRAIIGPDVVFTIFMIYLSARFAMKARAESIIRSTIGENINIKSIRILPSMTNLIRWHFIITTDTGKITGDVRIFPQKIRVLNELTNINDDLLILASNTPMAEFFSEFTSEYHINCEEVEDGYVFRFVDLRYYIAKEFVHNATTVLNKDFEVVKSLFHPYRKTRNVEV